MAMRCARPQTRLPPVPPSRAKAGECEGKPFALANDRALYGIRATPAVIPVNFHLTRLFVVLPAPCFCVSSRVVGQRSLRVRLQAAASPAAPRRQSPISHRHPDLAAPDGHSRCIARSRSFGTCLPYPPNQAAHHHPGAFSRLVSSRHHPPTKRTSRLSRIRNITGSQLSIRLLFLSTDHIHNPSSCRVLPPRLFRLARSRAPTSSAPGTALDVSFPPTTRR